MFQAVFHVYFLKIIEITQITILVKHYLPVIHCNLLLFATLAHVLQMLINELRHSKCTSMTNVLLELTNIVKYLKNYDYCRTLIFELHLHPTLRLILYKNLFNTKY